MPTLPIRSSCRLGYTWQVALAAVFVEGLVFILLSLTNIREAIFNAIPLTLKRAISVGIGLFIAFIGLLNAKIVVANPATKVSLYSFTKAVADGTFHSVGITVVIALIGILFTGFLIIKNIRGNILFGILGTWILGMIAEASGLYIPDPKLGTFSVFPNLSAGLAAFHSLKSPAGLGQNGFLLGLSLDFFAVIFAFLFVDLFDTLGTLIGVASKSNMLDEKGRLPHIKGALMADSVATCTGASWNKYGHDLCESAAGVAEGGRTGLTAVTVSVLFLLSLFLSPFFMAIPAFATAPALIVVGFLMFSSVNKIDMDDLSEAIPAYIAIIAMPFCYSISEGISFGVISYTILNVLTRHTDRISALMYILTILFIGKYIML